MRINLHLPRCLLNLEPFHILSSKPKPHKPHSGILLKLLKIIIKLNDGRKKLSFLIMYEDILHNVICFRRKSDIRLLGRDCGSPLSQKHIIAHFLDPENYTDMHQRHHNTFTKLKLVNSIRNFILFISQKLLYIHIII